MPQVGWLFTPKDPKESLEATGNLIFAARIHIQTLIFYQKQTFVPIGKLLSLFPFYRAIIYSNHRGYYSGTCDTHQWKLFMFCREARMNL